MPHRVHVAMLLALLVGCRGSAPPEPRVASGATTSDGTPIQRLARITVTGYTTDELMAELERARTYLGLGQYADAARSFDRLMRLTTDPELRALAAFDSGLAHEAMSEIDIAAERYRTVADEHRDLPIAKSALVRLTRVYGYVEKWSELEEAAGRLLARRDLPIMDRIEGLGARGLAHAERGDIGPAQVAVAKAYELVEKHGLRPSGAPPVQLAQVAFAEGEIRRLKSERIKLTPVPPNFAEVLEARCQGLLDAQGAYTDAMRSKDAHWSAMSGYRIGQLYQQLHREAMEIPPPKHASLDQQRLFEAAMRLRYRILLEKGLKMMDGTVRLGERTGESSYWIARARDAKAALEQALADEKAALEKVPYKEEDIRAALELLKGQPKTPKP